MKTILITGASSGIGRAASIQLVEQGYCVAGIARDFAKMKFHHAHFKAVNLDLADLKGLPGQLDGLTREFPEVHAVIHNAGRGHFGNLENFSFEQIRALVDLNFTAHAYVTRAFLPSVKTKSYKNKL